MFIFVPKRNGDLRTILNLKWLNQFLKKRKFRMETWRSIVATMEESDFMASINLSEAYLCPHAGGA